MSSALESANSPNDPRHSDERKKSPPAFLDLADSAARLGSNMPDISARVELKRKEHERQRTMHRKLFEDQMRALEHQQAQELLNLPLDANNSIQHLAVSAPTTPPRIPAVLGDQLSPGINNLAVDPTMLSRAVGNADKRKSVTYTPTVSVSPEIQQTAPELLSSPHTGFARGAGAKSMPASRRTSASSQDEELANHLQGLSIAEMRPPPHSATLPVTMQRSKSGNFGRDNGFGGGFNAGMMLDEQLDQEMHNDMFNLPIADQDKFSESRGESFAGKLSTSSAALDLAPLSQTPPRTSFINRTLDNREKSSEWPQFSSGNRVSEVYTPRIERRTVTTPQLGVKPRAPASTAVTPRTQHHTPNTSRRSSPLGIPLSGSRPDLAHLTKTALSGADPQTPGGSSELAAVARLSSGQYDMASMHDEALQYDVESIYGLGASLDNPELDGARLNPHRLEANGRNGINGVVGSGSTALYHHHGSRYGLGMGRVANTDSKMNGLHGPKHKRGDIDREFNRFAGTRLEDLQGEIATLCKDQHGCRYLQKKLEEGIPEHRDMIFRETFSHFAELMTDPFGNYLCQKLLEYSTDEQRNVICESVAQDLVTISLNMHGTRAVQKMIDFLSTQRQADLRYNAQIHSIIVALSLHVVVLIKDLNGNHVIQKCLNKLAPEDNQFIYNAVAANCVEVATHRHGCCVLQRCIDHASENQRIQLVSEITYNALTLVQDPYGNYVVQYILDLNDNRFSDGVIRQFTGNVCALSVQKFSSNVIEKCIRVAEHNTRKMLIEELLNRTRLEKLLRDSFGNYCVQTALDYAEPSQRALLVEGIRPILPLIRNTPYGKRIQSKLQREQVDMINVGHPYPGYHNQPQGLMTLPNSGVVGHNIAGLTQNRQMQSIHNNQLADVYSNPNSLYGLGQNGSMHNQQAIHLQGQQLAHTMQPHASNGYLMQGGRSPSNGLATNGNGFGTLGSFNPPASFGNSGLSGGMNGMYQQRPTFRYGGM